MYIHASITNHSVSRISVIKPKTNVHINNDTTDIKTYVVKTVFCAAGGGGLVEFLPFGSDDSRAIVSTPKSVNVPAER